MKVEITKLEETKMIYVDGELVGLADCIINDKYGQYYGDYSTKSKIQDNGEYVGVDDYNVLVGNSLYEVAEQKVKNIDALSIYDDFILADWNEGNEHWQWIIKSSEDEILDWVESCQE